MAMLTRFRAPGRDRQTDIERIGAVRCEVRKALLSIERERVGLSGRLEEARTRTASLLGNDDGIYFQREPADEQLLVEAESQMMYAYARLDDLQSQQQMLALMLGNLDNIDETVAPSQLPPPLIGAFLRRSSPSAEALLVVGRRICAALGWAILLAIVYATFSSIDQRPSLPWFFPDFERFFAFFAAAFALGLGYPRHRVLLLGAGLAVVAALELGQMLVATRHGTFHDAWVKAAGLIVALALVPMSEWVLRERYREK